jgi:hypothetical protein
VAITALLIKEMGLEATPQLSKSNALPLGVVSPRNPLALLGLVGSPHEVGCLGDDRLIGGPGCPAVHGKATVDGSSA